ncbi:DegT/DnrJ/EryC1/StrS family aminotransferase [Ferribacterium limneticum]|uniref:DegT/DnrJ/EryC1/StrS family aminotransferase n=1 Tax=Ferribacterium limneticum TaxID=76259 RepID=UPI001CFB6308|nr:DegT/DnrJ/EryC1/StrS family aminotransferase [Ferribacterium limneticum]UCV17308.1 DegT/DnrJ/EryC1/StrS family aminotransferase [Ferribacterium limneticum]
MLQLSKPDRPIPRLPVFGWDTFSGTKASAMPSVLDAKCVLYTTSGRASIFQALRALNISSASSVLVPTYHCPTMVAPIVALGALPIFCPIDSSGHIPVDSILKLARADTKAIIAPHFFGLPQPMGKLRQWCDENGVALIEDCAHALFGKAGSRNIGAWGDLAIASLTKFLPVSEGGCLICNHTTPGFIALQQHSTISQIKAALDIIEEGARFVAMPGLNYFVNGLFALKRRLRRTSGTPEDPTVRNFMEEKERLGAINPRLADTQMAYACQWIALHAARQRIVSNRRHNYAYLAEALSNSPHFRPLLRQLPRDCAPYVFPLWVEHPDPAYLILRERRIPIFRWDRLWNSTPVIPGDVGKAWSHHVYQLVCHQDLRQEELDLIVANLWELLG